MVTAVSSEGERARERVYRVFQHMSSSQNRREEGRDSAGTSLPLAFSCRDTGRRRAIPLPGLGHVAWPGVLGPLGICFWNPPAAEAPSCTFSRAWRLVLGTTGQLVKRRLSGRHKARRSSLCIRTVRETMAVS